MLYRALFIILDSLLALDHLAMGGAVAVEIRLAEIVGREGAIDAFHHSLDLFQAINNLAEFRIRVSAVVLLFIAQVAAPLHISVRVKIQQAASASAVSPLIAAGGG